jgi:hypothetical protein
LPAGSLRIRPFGCRTRNGASEAIVSFGFPEASNTRTFFTGAFSIVVPR